MKHTSLITYIALAFVAAFGVFTLSPMAHADETAIAATDDSIASEIMNDTNACAGSVSGTTEQLIDEDGNSYISITLVCDATDTSIDGDYTPDPEADASSTIDETTLPEVDLN